MIKWPKVITQQFSLSWLYGGCLYNQVIHAVEHLAVIMKVISDYDYITNVIDYDYIAS